ncbi:MAG: MaoC family dehydratase N-terminal domain-containing protein [Actinomycetia bacterium]|nr:MaoC family dehydratase N-terminal domain-containing protein [Actinomycetes bacterium]
MPIDRTLVGKTGPEVVVEVEAGHIRRFAEAVGDDSPLYTDPRFAAETPFRGVIAPPTFATTFPAGTASLFADVEGFELRRVLHGEQEYVYHRPVRPGQRLWVTSRVADVYERSGRTGRMAFIVVETVARDIDGLPVVTGRSTIVYRHDL